VVDGAERPRLTMAGSSGRGHRESEVDGGQACSHRAPGRRRHCENLTCAGRNLAKCGGVREEGSEMATREGGGR
jgi:hypothetical protein